jgi:carboxyl-terminal processing protease
LSLVTGSQRTPVASAEDVVGLDTIGSEYYDLLAMFYRPIDPHDLLKAGWTAIGADAERRGVSPPDPLPDLPDNPDAALATFSSVYSAYVASSSLPATSAAADVETAMAASVHEQHTRYISPPNWRASQSALFGGQRPAGIGVFVRELDGHDPPWVVTEVAPGSSAEAGGILPGDLLIGIGGQDVSQADRATLFAALNGSPDLIREFTFDRGSGPFTVTLTRRPFYLPPLKSSLLPNGIGYLRMASFVYPGTKLPDGSEILADLDNCLDDLDAQGAQSLILDLRNNGGGSLQTMHELLGRFLPDNVRTIRRSDERGHMTYDLVGGRPHARQLPMVVLVNGGSASASEMTASTLHDAHRVLLVGQQTAGVVANSQALPLPGGGGLQVAVAAVTMADSNKALDGVGVTPDIAAPSPSLDDYRAGRDPQVEAAISALASAPAPPILASSPPAMTADELDQLLGAVLPEGPELPTNDRLTSTARWQRLNYTHPNERVGGARDPLAQRQTLLSRGYEGSLLASYGGLPGERPIVGVRVDLYSNAAGAHAAMTASVQPEQGQSPMDAPVQLGNETVASRGAWVSTGSTSLSWRRGRVVFTTTYSDGPGFDRPDTLVAVSQVVDSRSQQLSIPDLP